MAKIIDPLDDSYGVSTSNIINPLDDVNMEGAIDPLDDPVKPDTPIRQGGFGTSIPDSASNLPNTNQDDSTSLGDIAGVAGAGAAQGTLAISRGIWETPSAFARVTEAINQFGKRMGLPDWMTQPIIPAKIQGKGIMDVITTGVDIGDYHVAGTSDVADAIGHSQDVLPQEFKPFKDLSKASQDADKAFDALLDGDFSKAGKIISDPKAVIGFLSQAVPSLVAAYKSGGSLPFMAWLESMEVSTDATDFEKRTGQKVDPIAFTKAMAQVATVNSYLEKVGLDKILGSSGNLFSRFLKGGLGEGSTELLQNSNTNLSIKSYYDPAKSVSEGALQSFIGGFGAGGALSAVAGDPNPGNIAKPDKPEKPTPDSSSDPLDAGDVIGGVAGDVVADANPDNVQYEGGVNFVVPEPQADANPDIIDPLADDFQYDGGIDFTVPEPQADADPLSASTGATEPAINYPGGIDFAQDNNEPELPSLDATIETERDAARRIDLDNRVNDVQNKTAGIIVPKGLNDPRIKRVEYRDGIQGTLSIIGAASDKKSTQVDSTTDDILTAIAKIGGINRDEALAQGFDPENFKDKNKVFGRPLFPAQGGNSFDAIAELLSQDGYIDTNYTANEAVDKLGVALGGDSVFSVNVDQDKLQALSSVREIDGKASHAQVATALTRALEGKPLGKNQANIVKAAMDNIQAERESPANIDDAVKRRDKARSFIRFAIDREEPGSIFQDERYDNAGSHFDQTEYNPDWSAETMAFYELLDEASQYDSDAAEAIAGRNISDYQAAQMLGQLIREGKDNGQEQQKHEGTEGNGSAITGTQEERNPAKGTPEAGTFQLDQQTPPSSSVTDDAAQQNDIFGTADANAQAIHDKTISKDIQRNGSENQPVESGDGDLFSGKSKQVDIDDAQKTTSPTPKKKEFTPTHELPDGTAVKEYVEDGEKQKNTWIDKEGDIIEDDNATVIANNESKPSKKDKPKKKTKLVENLGPGYVAERLVSWKKGEKIGLFDIEKITNDSDGYPVGVTLENKSEIDIVELIFKGDKEKFRKTIDEVRDSTNPTSKQDALKKKAQGKTESKAPEHQDVGVDNRELNEIVKEFNDAQESSDEEFTHVFDDPAKNDIVRLNDKVKVYHKDHGWMTIEEAKKKIDEWEENAVKQGKGSANQNKVVLSLFDLTGKWSLPWEQAGYQVYRFDIQDNWLADVYNETVEADQEVNIGDINNHGFDLYADMFGMFEGADVYAVLAACPCTDFASSGARHFAAKDKDGRTAASVNLVHQTLNIIEYFKPPIWALENPVGRIERLGGLPPWRLSFDPNHVGEDYTKKTLIWGRFNADLPIAPTEATEGSKMHTKYGGKSLATKNARSATPEGFAYSFFQANNAIDNLAMAVSYKYDRLDSALITKAVDQYGFTEKEIDNIVEDYYYQDLDDDGANKALKEAISEKADNQANKPEEKKGSNYGSGNKLVSSDRADEIRAKLKAKLNNINSGLDPELIALGTELAVYHIEAGARSFSDYSKKMINDMGDAIKPYIRSFYEGARYYPGLDNSAMTSASDIDSKKPTKKTKPEPDTLETGDLFADPAILRSEENTNELPDDNQRNDQGPESDQVQANEPERGAGSDNNPVSGTSNGSKNGGSKGSKKPGGQKRPTGRSGNNEHGGNERTGDRNGADNDRTELPVRTNYRITDNDNLGAGSALQKAKANIEAIRIIKTLQKENRSATKSEQKILASYTGWGASELANKLFPSKKEPTGTWKELHDELREILTEEELKTAARSTQYAHYTSKPIIDSIYTAIGNFGFKRGLAIEGGSGTGNFIGLIPNSMNIHYTGIEMDSISAAIAKLLYPQSGVISGDFTKIGLPQNHFDLSIGNPPFAGFSVKSDPRYKSNNFKLHDYFIAKQIDSVKPGGIAVFVTSKGTMDKADNAARAYLAERARLLGAIRLPQTAFKENAGTEVVTDILFFQKLGENVESNGSAWTDTHQIDVDGGKANINSYFVANPNMVLGTQALEGSMYGSDEYTVLPSGNLNEQLKEAIGSLPSNVYNDHLQDAEFEAKKTEFSLDPKQKESSYFIDGNNELRNVEDGVGVRVKVRGNGQRTGMSKKQAQILRDYIPLRDAVMKVYLEQFIDGDWKAAQKVLDKAYDTFTSKHGPINQVKTIVRKDGIEIVTEPIISTIDLDPEAYRVAGIEHYDEATNTAEKGSIFTENVMTKRKEAEIESVTDALNVTLNDRGYVDIDYLAEKYGVSPSEAIEELDAVIFQDPDTGRYLTEDDYLSGNVKQKLESAKAAAKNGEAGFDGNIKALEAVQPEDLPLSRVPVNLGAHWIDKEIVQKFAEEVLSFDGRVDSFIKGDTSSWSVTGESKGEKYATARMTASKILEAALNKRTIKVYDTFKSGGQVVRELNKTETAAANQKAQELKEQFSRWALSDTQSADALHNKYNAVFNTTVPRKFNGKHLTLPRLSSRYKPHSWQTNVVWRILQRGNTYMAHTVGSGKTLASNIAGMELRRLGLAKKPTYVVLKSTLKQFATELLDAYPDAKILVADEKQLDKKNRRRFLSRMASEDWDAVIMTHQSFEKIAMSDEFITNEIEAMLTEYRKLLEEVDESDRASRKTIERQIEAMESRLNAMTSQEKKDAGITFEETGIDFLFVDEAHTHKKIPFPTEQSNTKGVDSTGSGIALDLYLKSRYLNSVNPGRNMVLMSGTPVTNTLGEVFNIQRYLQPEVLRDNDTSSFDSWSATFADTVTELEMQASGSFKPSTRLAKFVGVPALLRDFLSIADIVSDNDLKESITIKRPAVKGGARQIVSVKRSPEMLEFQDSLKNRITKLEEKKGPAKKGEDNILVVINDAKKASIDLRLVGRSQSGKSKLDAMIDAVYQSWKDNSDKVYYKGNKPEIKKGATQLIFTEIRQSHGFDIYEHIRSELVNRGVPKNEIAFIQDATNSNKKKKLFRDMNTGVRRILIGGSKNMGTGVNVQQRLYDLHHLDIDYLPANIVQREGRAIRQGNKNDEVGLYAYATEGTIDSFMWQLNETKQKMIDQVMSGDLSIDSVEDVSDSANQMAMAKALSSGNPLLLEQAGLISEVKKLESLKFAHINQGHSGRLKIENYEKRIPRMKKQLDELIELSKIYQSTSGDKFAITLGQNSYTDRKKAGIKILAIADKLNADKVDEQVIGKISGYPITFSRHLAGWEVGLYENDHVSNIDGKWLFNGSILSKNDSSPAALGTVRRLENAARGLSDVHLEFSEEIQIAEKKLGVLKNESIGEFQYEDDLKSKSERLAEIESELESESPPPKDPLLSRSNKPANSGLSSAQVVDIASDITSDWVERPQIITVQSVDQLPDHILNYLHADKSTNEAEGLYDVETGAVWLIADNIRKDSDVPVIVMHEVLGHYGLRKVFGKNLDKLLNLVVMSYGRKGLADLAKKYKLDLNKPKQRLIAAEEMLARIAETGEKPTIYNKLIAMVREWMRKVWPSIKLSESEIKIMMEGVSNHVKNGPVIHNQFVNSPIVALSRGKDGKSGYNQGHEDNRKPSGRQGSFDSATEPGRTSTDDKQSIRAGRRAISKGIVQDLGRTGSTSRSEKSVTKTPAFKSWFGDSKIIDSDSNPLILFHGSNDAFDVFDRDHDSTKVKVPGASLGHFFSPDARRAGGYGDVVRGFFMKMENPHYMTMENFLSLKTSDEAKSAADELIKQGHDGIIIAEDGSYVVFDSNQIKSTANNGDFSDDPSVYLSRRDDDNIQGALADDVNSGQYVDRMFRSAFKLARVDQVTTLVHDKAIHAITKAKFKDDGHMSWMNGFIENVRAGMIDRYGLDEEFKRLDQERDAQERRIATKGVDIIMDLLDRGVDFKEAKVLQAVLNGEIVGDAEMQAIAEPIRNAIDDLGREAVSLGLLDEATFQQNRLTYLHRVYKKHEADQDTLGGWASKAMSKRRKRIAGDTFKQRGMNLKVSEGDLTKLIPDWFGQKKNGNDASLIDQEFIVFDRMSNVGQGVADLDGIDPAIRKPKILERIYWPANKPVPAKYEAWENKGKWTVRESRGGKYTLWRDFTKEERINMGEILDARYTIAKTFHMMSSDLANGRFLKDISLNPAWTFSGEGEPEGVIGEPTGHRWSVYTQYEWIQVPSGNIPGTNKKRWGALSGKYVRAEIWRDINELFQMQKPKSWNKILTQWKLNKTARNPVVHMNNVMSNMIFMDMADVRWRDLKRGIYALRHKTQDYQDALEHGAFGSGFVLHEIKREVLNPILDEILEQNNDGDGYFERKIGQSGKLVDGLWKLVKKADNKMISTYQLEDEVFRMATYMRRLGMGDHKDVAAQIARDQFLNYDIRAPFVNVARSSVLPFIAYTYRAIPVIAKAVAERPWKLAKYTTIAYMINAMGYLLAPSGDDEDKERRSLHDSEQGNTWLGTPRMIRAPWLDSYGNPVFMDIRRWIPAGDVFDTNQGQSAIPIPAWLQFGGPLMLGMEFALNKTAFTGKEIINPDTDDGVDRVNKVAGWAWKSWMPSAPWIYNSWYWDKIARSVNGGRDMLGRPYDLGYSITSSIGIKLKASDVSVGISRKLRGLDATMRELKYEYSQNELDRRRNLISNSAYLDRKSDIESKMKQVGKKARGVLGR